MRCTWAHGWSAAAALAAATGWCGVRPTLRLSFDTNTPGCGLVTPSGGDGVHEPAYVAGVPARRLVGEKTHYLYVRVEHPSWTNGPADAWAAFEIFDDRVARIGLQYERGPSDRSPAERYAASPRTGWLTGTRQWRRLVFPMPGLALARGQNQRADFRLCARGVAVRAVEVSAEEPPDAHAAAAPPGLVVARPAGMELTFGNDASSEDAVVYRALSVSSVESYVDWAGVEPERDRWDWSRWDVQVAVLEAAGLRWVPFLIAGPAYATPLWFQRSPESCFYRCLDHGREGRVQSLFNPALRPWVERFVKAFADRYRDRGVIESVLLGITGIYGESIYPAGPEGGWTARLTGIYHNHAGWWAGDDHAAAAFRSAIREHYRDATALNRAWGAAHPTFDAVAPFLPERAIGDRARADMVEWYQQAMTDWCVTWARAVRTHFPATPVYLCTGGDGDPMLGADFTAQAKAVAPFGVGLRITNEGSDYAANFTLTREVATATRAYGTFCGFEPAGGVDASGNVARIYNASASGARQLHVYANNVLGGDPEALDLFVRWAPMLAPRTPRTELAVYLPREAWAIDPAANGRLRVLTRVLRDIADHDFVTRLTVRDGHLKRYGTLLVAEASAIEPDAAAAMEAWVAAGGTLVVATRPGETVGARLYDLSAWRERMLAPNQPAGREILTQRLDGSVPPRWELDVGSADDGVWLDGDWHGPESRGEASCRWTGARAIVRVPAAPGVPARLALDVAVPGPVLRTGPVRIAVDGRPVGTIGAAGARRIEFDVPSPSAPGNLALVELQCATWKPSEVANSSDSRSLGVEVRRVVWHRADAAEAQPGRATVVRTIDPAAVAAATRAVGRGRTIRLDGLAASPDDVARAIAFLMPNLPDGRLDRRYATRTSDGVLWFDPALPSIRLSP